MGKSEKTVRCEIESAVLCKYNINTSAYHGRNLNGVAVHQLMGNASEVFSEIEMYLSSLAHDGKGGNDETKLVCEKYQQLLLLLDGVFSVLCIPHGKPVPDDYKRGQDFTKQAAKLWDELHLPSTPKQHVLLDHALDQMESFLTLM